MSGSLRQFVRERASFRCEYCQLPDFAAPASAFHVEHVFATQHGGSDHPDNRCWSCHRCNLHKGPNLSGRDPLTDNIVRLFDPRRQSWQRHFEWIGAILVGRTQTGRATIAVLDINEPQRVELRQILRDEGEWPQD
ncbi:MAG TPA: HNH endonuclease [Pirellulales bacterium]|nr:HNH endonuclease [Pirellulales bacterium]